MQAGAGYVRAVRDAARGASITHARAHSPLRVFAPKTDPRSASIITSTLGGGLVGGDAIDLSIDVEPGAHVILTSQALTKVYRSPRPTRQRLTAHVARGAV